MCRKFCCSRSCQQRLNKKAFLSTYAGYSLQFHSVSLTEKNITCSYNIFAPIEKVGNSKNFRRQRFLVLVNWQTCSVRQKKKKKINRSKTGKWKIKQQQQKSKKHRVKKKIRVQRYKDWKLLRGQSQPIIWPDGHQECVKSRKSSTF